MMRGRRTMRTGDKYPLSLSARKSCFAPSLITVYIPIGIALDVRIEPAHAGRFPGVVHAQAMRPHDVVEDVHRMIWPVCSATPSCARTACGSEVGKVLAVVVDRAGLRLFEAEQQTNQRGLSGSGRTDDCDELAGAHGSEKRYRAP
jgi:hypothetical protein